MFSLPGYIGLHWFVIFQKDGLCFGGINFNIDIILFCLFFKKSWIIFEWDIASQCSSDFAYLYLSDIAFRYGYLLVYIYFIQVLDWCHQLYCQPTRVSTERGGGGQRFSIWEGLFFTTCAFLWSFVPRPIPIKIEYVEYVVDLREGEGKLLMYPKLQVCFHTFKISKI